MIAALEPEKLSLFLSRAAGVAVIVMLFVAAAFVDARRLRRVWFTDFLWEVKRAVILILPVTPCILAFFSTILFFCTTILGKLKVLSPPAMEEITRYGTMHAPLITLYYVLKREWVAGCYQLPKYALG